LAAALVLGVMSFSPTLRADSKQADPKKVAEAQALLDKAERLSRLTEKGSPPFALQATIVSGEGKQKQTADFYLLWQDAEHWRAMAVKGDHREIHVRNPEGLWLPKIPDRALGYIFGSGAVFPFMQPLIPSADERIDGTRERKVNKAALSCVLLRGERAKREICVNPSSSLLERMDSLEKFYDESEFVDNVLGAVLQHDATAETNHEYSDYEKFGEKMVPHDVKWVGEGHHVYNELRIVTLATNPQTASDLYAVPADYEVWPYCDRHTPPEMLRPIEVVDTYGVRFTDADLARPADGFFLVVAPDGKIREVRLLNPTGRNTKKWIDLLMKQHYAPATCDGKPVPGRMFIPVP
jgi:hypothetical protein